MKNHIPVVQCQYCSSEDLGVGWQHGEGLVTFKYHGLLGNRLKYIHLSAESFPAILKQSEALFGNLIPLEDNSNETSI